MGGRAVNRHTTCVCATVIRSRGGPREPRLPERRQIGVHHDPHAGDDRLLVHIEAGYALMNDAHPSHTDAAGVVT